MTICSDIEREIQPFLDDLLSEADYQSAHAHIENCSKCQRYVSAIGSFSYILKELGEVEVPQDLEASILFNLKTQGTEIKSPKAQPKKILIVSALVAVLTGVTIYFGFHYFKMQHRLAQETEAPIVSSAEVIQEKGPTSPEEAAFLFEKLKAISSALGDPEEGAQKANAEKSSSPTEKQEALALPTTSADEKMVAQKTVSFHWHFPHSEGTESEKILEVLTRLGAQYDYKLPELIILSLSPSQFKQFVQEMELVAPRALPVRDIDFQKLSSPNQQIHLSIYLEKNGRTEFHTLHWHIRIPRANEFRLFEVFRQMNLTLDYDSPELVVLTMSSTKVGELIRAVQTIEAVSANFSSPDLSKNPLLSYPVQVSIYLTEA